MFNSFLHFSMHKVDCKWGEWQIGGERKCPTNCRGKRHDIRDFDQGAMYGGKQCTGSHYRICDCCGVGDCPGNILKFSFRKLLYKYIIEDVFQNK